MGNELFGLDIAAIVADQLGDGLPDVTIAAIQWGARNPANLSAGRTQTPRTITGVKGFWDDYRPSEIDGTTIMAKDRRAVLLGDTLPPGYVPQKGDTITVHETLGDVSLPVIGLESRDAAAAHYVLQCGDRKGPDGR